MRQVARSLLQAIIPQPSFADLLAAKAALRRHLHEPPGKKRELPEDAARIFSAYGRRPGQALPDDAQYLVGSVDGAGPQRGGLADPQAARIHDGEARLVDRVANTAEQAPT